MLLDTMFEVPGSDVVEVVVTKDVVDDPKTHQPTYIRKSSSQAPEENNEDLARVANGL